MDKYDAVVIGGGNGGLVAAIRLLQGGAKTISPAVLPQVLKEEDLNLKPLCTN